MPEKTRFLRVAAAQIAIGGDIEENLRSILEAMRRSADLGATLVVLPETALTGYSPDLGRRRPPEDWPTVQMGLERIQEAAQALAVGAVVGSEAWENGAWVNRLYAFSEQGALLGYYDKVHLTRADTQYYRPGNRYTVVTFQGVQLGLQICYDARFPEGYRALLDQGVEVVAQGFYGAGTGTWKVPVLEAHLRSRAAENGCFVVAANVSGPLQIVVSQIVDPLGLILARANQDWPEIIVADLSLGRILESEARADFLSIYRDRAASMGPANG